MFPELDRLNNDAPADALQRLTALVENSPWVARQALQARPFHSDEELASVLVEIILAAGPAQRLALFNAHPELGGTEAVQGRMTPASTGEQGRLGLHCLDAAAARRLARLNHDYRRKFRHPFIIALHRVPEQAVLFERFKSRLEASPLEEHVTTLAEITSVIRSRSRQAFGQPVSARSPHEQQAQESYPL